MIKGAEPPPDAAVVMYQTRAINNWLHTHYTLEEVAGMDPLLFDIMGAVAQGMNPKKGDDV